MLKAEDARRLRQGSRAVGHLQVRAGRGARSSGSTALDAGGDHAGIHRARRRGQHLLLGRGGSDTSAAYLAAKIERRAARDLDRRARHVQRQSALHAHRAPAPRAALRRSAGNRDQRREGAASALPAAGAPVPDTAVCATPRRRRTSKARVITGEGGDGAAQVKAVCHRKGITLISLDSPGMWHQVGFLADAFAGVQGTRHVGGPGVDLGDQRHRVARSGGQYARRRAARRARQRDLSKLCRVQVIGPCASVTLVGRNIRAILHKLGDAFALFEEQKVYLVSQAANDLNFTFVVDENQGDRLVEQLHELLIRPVPGDRVLGPDLGAAVREAGRRVAQRAHAVVARRSATQLLATLASDDSRLRLRPRARCAPPREPLRGIKSVARASVRAQGESASGHPARAARGGHRFRVRVAGRDRARARRRCPASIADASCSRRTSRRATNTSGRFEQGVHVTVDNLYVLRALARRVPRPRDLPAHRHRHRPRPPPSRAHRPARSRSSACRSRSSTSSRGSRSKAA